MRTRLSSVPAIIGALLVAGCTVHQTDVPPLTGPSTVAHSVTLTLSPTTLSQDGSSTSVVKVTTNGPSGPESQTVRLDMLVGGQLSDGLGTLSARTITTTANGTGSVIFTAPPPPAPPALLSVSIVSIRASLTGSDALSSTAMTADLRLVPLGTIIPVGDAPTVVFTISPPPVSLNTPSTFDASRSCPSTADASGNCIITSTTSQTITNFAWDFGDGGTANGKIVTHSFTTPGTFSVTLTVTNDHGVSATKTQSVTLGAPNPAAGDWVFSPIQPTAKDEVAFNADGVHAAAGHSIVQFNWDFGDPSSGALNTASGSLARHTFATAGGYNVVLSVVDDTGQKTVIAHTVTVGTGNPVVVLVASPNNPSFGIPASFDASNTTFSNGATAVQYVWTWNDNSSPASETTIGPTKSHTFAAINGTGPFTVTVQVTDSRGRVGIGSVVVTPH
jgi:PKD repeat protein